MCIVPMSGYPHTFLLARARLVPANNSTPHCPLRTASTPSPLTSERSCWPTTWPRHASHRHTPRSWLVRWWSDGACGLQKYGAQLGSVEAIVKVNGGLSGGTAASMMEMASQGSGGGSSRFPFLLNPRGQWSSLRVTPLDKDNLLPFYHPVTKCVLSSRSLPTGGRDVHSTSGPVRGACPAGLGPPSSSWPLSTPALCAARTLFWATPMAPTSTITNTPRRRVLLSLSLSLLCCSASDVALTRLPPSQDC